MIRQMFKLIWNRKKRNLLMILGISISFFVLFIVSSIINYNITNYFKPLGYEYEDVWYLTLDWKSSDSLQIESTLAQIENALKTYPEIEEFSYCRSLLFTPMASNNTFYHLGDHNSRIERMYAGDQLPEVLDFEILEGRWFDERDNVEHDTPIVITQLLADEFFLNENPIGKKLTDGQGEKFYKVIGLIGEFRNGGELTGSKRASFERFSLNSEPGLKRILSDKMLFRILMKMRSGSDSGVEEKILMHTSAIAKEWTIKSNRLEDARSSARKQSLIIPVIIGVICAFLLINVALGLFGVIWYNTHRRKAEIGLRRAMGAHRSLIYIQIMGEALVLSLFGIFIGGFFAIQFPVLKVIPFISDMVYYMSFILSVAVILLLTVVCALYPSRLATHIQPALALHEEG